MKINKKLIMNTRITKEIAILLKEKGWNKNTYTHCWVKTLDGEVIHNNDRENTPEHDRCEQYLMQPTIAETIMWLYEKHNIWIVVNVGKPHLANSCMFYGNVIKFGLHHKNKYRTIFYNSPAEVYQEAILHILNHLI